MRAHLRYVAREGVTPQGERGQFYTKDQDRGDVTGFADRCAEDRHQFRFIVSPEDATELGDLTSFTHEVMAQMERDLETPLDWIAANHFDTDNPHVHIVLRGKDSADRDLVIDREYISHGMRSRAAEVATEWLGPKTERDIAQSVRREVGAERWTSLDAELKEIVRDNVVALKSVSIKDTFRTRSALLGRLSTLERLGLAVKEGVDRWRVSPELEPTLRALGERGDIVKAMHRSLKGERRELSLSVGKEAVIEGRVIGRGFADELHDRGYLVIDGIDGRAHYVRLGPKVNVHDFHIGSIVQARFAPEPRTADRRIAALTRDGVYRTEDHRPSLKGERSASETAGILEAHTRRLEALRRGGIVERLSEGVWQIPADVVERGKAYDQAQLKHPTVTLRARLSVKMQSRAIGATWLDEQLARGAQPRTVGFGHEVLNALAERETFLLGEGLAQRRAGRLLLARDFLRQLRVREIESVAARIAAETGLTHRPLEEGTSVSGTYRRSLQLVSGRFAMLDDGVGFSLVPWRSVIEQRLGQSLTALSRGDRISWYFGRSRDLER
jgi:type IV secretory pathway VirD2 relaxase